MDRSEMPALPTLYLGRTSTPVANNTCYCNFGKGHDRTQSYSQIVRFRFISHGIGPMPLMLEQQHPFARCLAEIPLRLQLDENRVARSKNMQRIQHSPGKPRVRENILSAKLNMRS